MMDRGRLEAFSDGVFAVAITLLALNLAVKGPPDKINGTLAYQLGHQWAAYAAYLISFFTIGIIWVNHHTLVSNIVIVTRLLLFLNLVLLLFVVLIPVATGTVGDYLPIGGFDAKLAVAVYGIALTGMSIGFSGIAEWSLGEGRTRVPVPPDKRWAARIRFMSGGPVYLLVVALAFLSAPAALGLSGLVGVYYVLERTPAALSGTGDTPQESGQDT